MRLVLVGLLLATSVNCALLRPCRVQTRNLYWYEYVQDDMDEGRLVVNAVKTEQDPTLKTDDYVFTDGMTYRVTDMTWVEDVICHGKVVATK